MSDTMHTRPVRRLELFWRWCQRHPIIATLAVFMLLTSGFTGWLVAREWAHLARQAEIQRLEQLQASDLLLAQQALQDTHLEPAENLLRDLQAALERWPTNTVLWRSRAAVLQRTGALDEALAHLSRALELASTQEDSAMFTDVLLRRRDVLRELNRGAEAGMDERRARGLPYEHIPTNALPDFQAAEAVSVEFGETIREAGLYVTEAGDSKHTPASKDGQEAWFYKAGVNYAYFYIDPTFKWTLGSNAIVRVEYQILGRNPMGLHFDGARSPYAEAAEYRRGVAEPTNPWRIIEFQASDARFRNSQNGRADFRLHDNEKGFFLRRISVSRYQRKSLQPRDPSTSSNLIDLTAFYNASARLYMPAGDSAAATNVLRVVRQRTGVEFDARGYIGLRRRGDNSTNVSVTGIPIGRRLSRLHFLHSASYAETEGTQIGAYVMNMSDGSSLEFAIVYGRHVRTERGDYKALSEAVVAWDGEGIKTGAGTRVRIYKVTWNNPRPELAVDSIEFISTETKSSPHLLAITVE